jgi:hypothetical protein
MAAADIDGAERSDGTARVLAIIQSTRIAQMMFAMVELGIPDLLAGGPRSDADLAGHTGADGPSLHRLLRGLVAAEFLTQEPDGRFGLTASGQALRSDAPGGVQAQTRIQLHEARWRPWGDLVTSVRTGTSAMRRIFGMDEWEYLAHHPEVAERFNRFMSRNSMAQQDGILRAYDFSRFRTIVDVGGGHGQLLGAILRAYPSLHGILFDQPAVVAGAGAVLGELGVLDRCTVVGGSLLEAVPPGGDAYVLKLILHDWDDESARRILATVHRAMRPGDSLLVVERVLPEDRPMSTAEAISDLNMLIMLDGKERTSRQFDQLLESGGFRPQRIVPTSANVSVVEGVRL